MGAGRRGAIIASVAVGVAVEEVPSGAVDIDDIEIHLSPGPSYAAKGLLSTNDAVTTWGVSASHWGASFEVGPR